MRGYHTGAFGLFFEQRGEEAFPDQLDVNVTSFFFVKVKVEAVCPFIKDIKAGFEIVG